MNGLPYFLSYGARRARSSAIKKRITVIQNFKLHIDKNFQNYVELVFLKIKKMIKCLFEVIILIK